MDSYIVTVTDARGRKLRQFEAIAFSRGRAYRAGYEAAESLPNAANVTVRRA